MPFRHATFFGEGRATRHVFLGLAVLGLGSVGPATVSKALAIELHALDGSAVVKGDLVEISHGSYVVKTALGTLRIGLEEADCVGDRCPALERFDTDFSVLSSSRNIKSSMQAILSGYAETLDADPEVEDGDGDSSTVAIVKKESGERLATVGFDITGVEILKAALGLEDDEAADEAREGRIELSVFADRKPDEFAKQDDGVVLGLEGVAVIVHPDNQTGLLSRSEVAQLFTCGEESTVLLPSAVRNPVLYAPGDEADSYQAFKALVLDPFGGELCDRVTRLPSDDEVANAVANNPNAVGILSLAHRHDVTSLGIEECGIVHEASLFGAKAGDYPLARRILMKVPNGNEPSGAVERFIDFALSDAGQVRLESSGLVGLNLETTASFPSRYRLARIEAAGRSVQDTLVLGELVQFVQEAVRLSATFRFSSGASNVDERNNLDDRSQRDLIRVASFLRSEAPQGTEIFILGFADASGDYAANLDLSRQRAQSVADKLASLGVPITASVGFGEEAPIACNSNPNGRAQNRRVEVWLRFPEERAGFQDGIRITM